MKYKVLFCFLFLSCFITQAQSDLFKRSTALPALNSPAGGSKNNSFSIPSTSIPSTIIKSNTNYNENRFLLPEKPKDIGFFKKNQFENPGDQVKEKLNKAVNSEQSGIDLSEFRKNDYLGDFRNNGKFVTIKLRDFGIIDGDIVRIWVNDKILIQQKTLADNYYSFNLPLVVGFNKIEIEAINTGIYQTVCSEIEILSDLNLLITQHFFIIDTGFKASVIIVKE